MKVVKSTKEVKEVNAQEEAQNLMFETLLDTLMPKIKPAIGPATKKFTEFMKDGNMIVAKVVGDKVFFFHIREKDVASFEMNEGSSPVGSYQLDDFISKILTGNFSF